MLEIKRRIQNMETMVGTAAIMSDPMVCELLGHAGPDAIWLDTEHSTLDYGNVMMHLIAAKAGNVPVFVRVPWNDAVRVKKIIDQAPAGIIFPMVNSAEEADRAMKACLYPPEGIRGWGPLRCLNYGEDDKVDYIARAKDEMVRIIQIEHIDAIRNLREIVKNPYIDAYVIGPADLSGSLGHLYAMYTEEHMAAIDEAIRILKDNGKYIITLCRPIESDLEFWTGRGVNMIFAGQDTGYIFSGCKSTMAQLREAFEKAGR